MARSWIALKAASLGAALFLFFFFFFFLFSSASHPQCIAADLLNN
jgi:hypothetical protein